MALRNTIRRPARFVLAVGLLASAGMVFVAGMSLSLSAGTEAVAEEAASQTQWDVEVRLASSTSVDALAAVVEQVPDVDQVEGWTIASAAISGPGQFPISRTYPDQGHGGVSVTAVPADTTMATPRTRDHQVTPGPGPRKRRSLRISSRRPMATSYVSCVRGVLRRTRPSSGTGTGGAEPGETGSRSLDVEVFGALLPHSRDPSNSAAMLIGVLGPVKRGRAR